jgi:hypothetical protein
VPTPYAPTPVYRETTPVPVGGDIRLATSFTTPLQELSDGQRYLAERCGLDPSDLPNFNLGFSYASAATIYRTVPLSRIVFQTDNVAGTAHGTPMAPFWTRSETGIGSHVAIPQYSGSRCWAAIELPAGATLVDVNVWLKTSSARVGAARWQIAVYRQTLDETAAFTEAAPILIGAATDDGGANGYTMITLASLATAVSNGTTLYFVQIDAPTTPTANDWLHALRYRYTVTGPGGA